MTDSESSSGAAVPPRSAPRARVDLFAISLLLLFLELACIRWFPAQVLFLTFFTNTVLLAGFLGMSVGCLVTGHRRNYLAWTPFLLVLALGAAHLVEIERLRTHSIIDVGNQAAPQLVFFGVEYQAGDPASFVIPIEALCGFFFCVIALVHVGPGQALGRAIGRFTNRVEAYSVNILGSLAGVFLFAVCSRAQLSPVWWFAGVLALLAYFLLPARPLHAFTFAAAAALVLVLVLPAGGAGVMQFWSPYYRIDYAPKSKLIAVNLIGHQQMVSRSGPFPAYALPHLLNRDAGRPPFARVLIIGAGSGNDVSRALEWGADHVDAVEIDPVIYRLGRQHHPDQPYEDPRVTVHLDDGRNFLRSSRRKYDLIVYALVDSLVLHSSHSNIRLESYLFTQEAFADVRNHLEPGGLFVVYNYFRHGWVVGRLQVTLADIFGADNPLVLSLPARPTIAPDQGLFDEFTMFLSGGTGPIRDAFARQPEYWLRRNTAPDQGTPDGFVTPAPAERASARLAPAGQREWQQFSPTVVIPSSEPQRLATDDWPFLYLRTPAIPALSLRGMAIMGAIAVAMIVPAARRRRAGGSGAGPAAARQPWGFALQMFFLGAGFMLIETKAVVHMALLFGSTWTVNSIVFFAVLVTILLANLFVLAVKPVRVWPYYAALLVTLAAGALVPMDAFLGRPWLVQVAGSCAVAFAPIVFAGVVFAVRYGTAAEPDRAFGANVAGATAGGLAEYSSMVLGFQHLVLVALAFYALSALGGWSAARRRAPI